MKYRIYIRINTYESNSIRIKINKAHPENKCYYLYSFICNFSPLMARIFLRLNNRHLQNQSLNWYHNNSQMSAKVAVSRHL